MKDQWLQTPLNRVYILVWIIITIVGVSCNYSAIPAAATPTATESPVNEIPTLTPSATLMILLTTTSTTTPSPISTTTLAPSPTETPTATPVPIYIFLRGEVLVRSNCRYGPGAPYLYKYGLVAGSNLEIIGRNDLGTWILVRAIGGNNPCWVKASLMKIKGDVMKVAPTTIPLPPSPYYSPPKRVSARRDGEEVTVFWSPVQLRAGDDSEQYPYLIEAWVCTEGQLIFTPLGTYAFALKIHDEAGCSEASHGRLYAVEKHGYTRPVEIPWPAP